MPAIPTNGVFRARSRFPAPHRGDPSAARCIRRRRTREADLSTQQAGAQAPSWISRAHGDHGRAQGGCSAPQPRAQAAQRLTRPPRSIAMHRLKQRADFLAAANGAKVATAAFVLQGRERGDGGPPRVGFTVSRKVGTAVERNRVRRRLRDIVVRAAADGLRPGCDYVLIGRRSALSRQFDQMSEDFKSALRRLERPAGRQARERVGDPPHGGRNTGG